MSVTTEENVKSYACDGSKTDFDIPYKITGTDTSVLVVTLWEDATSTPTVLSEGSGAYSYSVSAPNNNFKDGGTVSTTKLDGVSYIAYAWASGYTITIERIVPYTQPSEFAAGGLDNKALEQTFDNLVFQIQQLDKRKSIHGPPSDLATVTYELPMATGGQVRVVARDGDGNIITIANVPTSGVSATAFAETLLDDATAAIARATLEITTANLTGVINVKDPPYNATGDGVTDETAAIQAAIDADGQYIFIPEGTFLCNLTVDGSVNIHGAGPKSILKAYTTDPVITVTERLIGLVPGRRFSNFTIDGNSKTSKGILYTASEVEADYEWILFQNCTRGLDWGSYGPIGNNVKYCSFKTCDYGIYAKDSATRAINLNMFNTNRFQSIALCGIYLNGQVTGVQGNVFFNNWLEGITGFGVIIFGNTGYEITNHPNVFSGGWFETVATTTPITLDDEGAQTAYVIWADSVYIESSSGSFPAQSLLNDCILTISSYRGLGVFADASQLVLTGTTRATIEHAVFDTVGGSFLVGSPTGSLVVKQPRTLGGGKRGLMVEGLPMINNVSGHTNMASIADLTEVSGASLTYQDAELFGSAVRRIALSDDTEYASVSVTLTNDKVYAYSFSIRSSTTTAEDDILITCTGTGVLISQGTLLARGDRWTHYVGAVDASATAPTGQTLRFKTSADATFDIARLQFIEFSIKEEAEAFIHNQQFALPTAETVTTGSPALTLAGTTRLDSSGGAITGTLADGGIIGGLKTIVMTDATTSSTITVAHHITSDPEVFTFAQVGDSLVLMWNGTDWMTIHNNGVAV